MTRTPHSTHKMDYDKNREGRCRLCGAHNSAAEILSGCSRALTVSKLKYQMAVAVLKPDHPLKTEGQADDAA